MVWHLIERVKRCELIDKIVVAFPLNEPYRAINDITNSCGVELFLYRGKIANLVGRHLSCAKKYEAEVIVRIPSDNPLIEPSEVDRIIDRHRHGTMDIDKYLYSNTHNINNNGYPDGLGAEVYSYTFLKWIKDNIITKEEAEHPHRICYDKGLVKTIECPEDIRQPELRLDVNTQKDYEFINSIYEALYPENPYFGIRDILKFLLKIKIDKRLSADISAKPLYRENMLNNLWRKVLK